jgi:cysteinyl-tRNA synthetase
LVLQSHYRGPMEVNDENIAAAEVALERFDNFARRVDGLCDGVAPDADVVERFRREMDDDFNTPPALASLWEALRSANGALDAGDEAAAAPLASAVVGLLEMLGVTARVSDVVDEASAAKAAARDEARAAKDWGRADALRAELEAEGWTVQDGPEGTRLTR